MRNGTYLFLCMLLLALVLGGCAGTRHSFQTTPTQEDGIGDACLFLYHVRTDENHD